MNERKDIPMYVITQNSKGEFASYDANQEEVNLFLNAPENFQDDLSGWVISDALSLFRELSSGQMLKMFNSLTGGTLVKFKDKASGSNRTFDAVCKHAQDFDVLLKTRKSPPSEKPKRSGRMDRGVVTIDAHEKARPCRANTKQQLFITALSKGATIADLLEATSSAHGGKNWTESSVRSGFYEDVNNKGYGVRTEIVKEGDPATYKYHLVYPEGITEVLPVKVSKAKQNDA